MAPVLRHWAGPAATGSEDGPGRSGSDSATSSWWQSPEANLTQKAAVLRRASVTVRGRRRAERPASAQQGVPNTPTESESRSDSESVRPRRPAPCRTRGRRGAHHDGPGAKGLQKVHRRAHWQATGSSGLTLTSSGPAVALQQHNGRDCGHRRQ